MRAKFLILLLASAILLHFVHLTPARVQGAQLNPPVVELFAAIPGWNSSTPPSNPTFTESVGTRFNVTAEFDDVPGTPHDFSIYTNGTLSGMVSTLNTCSLTNTNGCLLRSKTLGTNAGQVLVDTVSLTPLTSAATANSGGLGGYEYFCQFHPTSMHGHIKIQRNFALIANVGGWNSTSAGIPNPEFREFVRTRFTVRIQFADVSGEMHDFAIYANGTKPSSVSPSDPCFLTSTTGCVAKSQTVTSTSPVANLTLTPTSSALLPNFGGGGFEYFCQFHPDSMHGHITIDRNPDFTGPSGNPDGMDNILDVAAIAFVYGTSSTTVCPPTCPGFDPRADLDNNGRVNILDIALAAFYYGGRF